MKETMQIPEFKTKKELFAFLIENKDILITQKKEQTKHADGFLYVHTLNKIGKVEAIKANEPVDVSDKTEIEVVAIINTTNLMDSHDDVHMPGLWTKSLQENRMIMHLQEHSMSFSKIISEGNDLKAYTKFYDWADLGFEFKGKTQALVFNSVVKSGRNNFMFKQYANGFVKNHSVGMRYVKLLLAVNDEDWGAEFEAWEKYFPEIANPERAEAKGYFWVVKEAKVIEGSAVPLGSNFATPTLENNKDEVILTTLQKEIKNLQDIIKLLKEPQQEPVPSTQLESTQKELDLLKQLLNKLN